MEITVVGIFATLFGIALAGTALYALGAIFAVFSCILFTLSSNNKELFIYWKHKLGCFYRRGCTCAVASGVFLTLAHIAQGTLF